VSGEAERSYSGKGSRSQKLFHFFLLKGLVRPAVVNAAASSRETPHAVKRSGPMHELRVGVMNRSIVI
jgi:hypothetical protein